MPPMNEELIAERSSAEMSLGAADMSGRATPCRRLARILLTMPHLNSSASPYREMMALVRHLDRSAFRLTVCGLREKYPPEVEASLRDLGAECMVARFRPTGHTPGQLLAAVRDQKLIEQAGPFDIQHSLDFSSSPFEAACARLRSRKYVYNQRNLNEGGSAALLRAKLALSNRIITVAEHASQFVLLHGGAPGKLRRIYNGIDPEELDRAAGPALPMDQRQPYILVVGQIEPRKHHEDAIRSFAVLARENPQVRLGIAGSVYHADYQKKLECVARDLGVADRVDFLGARQDIPALMRRSRALLCCSESEGLPWVILEAMTLGLPVVASSIPAHCELLDHGRSGLLTPGGDVAGFASALEILFSSPSLGGNLARCARRTIENRFSIQAMVEQTQSVYEELLRSTPAIVKFS
jgi:glycosyltransferase involved in cell wall biosynthesis